VLDGCFRHFLRAQVDLCYIEYAGEVDLLPFFEPFGFYIYYTPVMVVSDAGGVAQKLDRVRSLSNKSLSTGKVGETFWPDDMPEDSADLPAYFKELRRHCLHAQTNLVCVAPYYIKKFEAAAATVSKLRQARA
jgi:hypothetical protein